ncbi:MAG: DUF423 domain-containing protein [Armatimonadetes bacterium]|nr:DUF423 domain-containing protein [Armatimonadota bacterium]
MKEAAAVAFFNLAAAVGLGAFGTHALQARIEPDQLAIWKTSQGYHLGVGVAILAIMALPLLAERTRKRAAWAMLAGTALFSGSLYALAVGAPRIAGAITPFGGATWIVTLVILGVSVYRSKQAA